MEKSKKELKKSYQQNPPAMGVYQVRNLVNEKIFVGSSMNLRGIFNRSQLDLKAGRHFNKRLQADWNEFGSENFAFEILDELSPTENPGYDYREDLALLEDVWLENLKPYGERGYNEEKLGPDEKLKRIAENRLAKQSD